MYFQLGKDGGNSKGVCSHVLTLGAKKGLQLFSPFARLFFVSFWSPCQQYKSEFICGHTFEGVRCRFTGMYGVFLCLRIKRGTSFRKVHSHRKVGFNTRNVPGTYLKIRILIVT